MGKYRESRKPYSQMVAGIIALMALTVSVGTVRAASVLNSCATYCHGAPLRDGVRKGNPQFGSQSSAVSGNHRNHLPAAPAAASCNICHTPVTPTNFGHQNNVIRMANSLKGYSSATLRAKYDKGVFFNQTSIPNLTNATCSNVNCHFEKKTPAWGTSAAGTTCETCHGALVTPLTLAHPKHIVALGNTITACASCHNSYAGAAAYTHATSAGRPIAVTVGVYAGSNGRYLPSQTGRVTGTCSSAVCHGSGTSVPWGGTIWSSTDQCGKCHSSTAAGAVTQAVPFYSTAYPVKVTANTDAKVGAHTNHMTSQALGISASTACTDCHGTVTLTGATHMNGSTTFAWSALATKNALLTPAYTAATGQCTATYCHGNSMPGGDATGTNKSPVWKDPNYLPATVTSAACGLCHGFPPSAASGHPGGITIPAGFPATAPIGATCSCHSNINTAGNSYATMFVNPALHINGILETPGGGHAVPFIAHSTPPFTSCTGCHNASAAGPYPAATAGTPPNCRGCHTSADPTVTTSGCTSCHSAPPSGTTHPNILGSHTKHSALSCTICHTGAGYGSGASHGPGNRGANPAVDDIIFTAAQAGASATWTAATKTCSTTYCHGATLTGGTTKNPVWGTTMTGCGICHGDPPATATHSGITVTQCINCHTHVNATGTGFTDATKHINGTIDVSGSCVGCHNKVITRTKGRPGTTLANVVAEFGLAWSHKRSAGGVVTDADCIVCHLEGDPATGSTSSLHQNGNIDLRDPDGATAAAAITNMSGAAFTFQRFSTSYAAGSRTTTGHTANTIDNVIQQKFCLKCHDANGATNAGARVAGGTQYKPFNTTIVGAGYVTPLSAGVAGGVVDVDRHFATTNSAAHPVKGPRNNSYASGTRMSAPYGVTKTAGTNNMPGVVINCWDCHNQPGTPLTRRTVTAHGAAATLRGNVWTNPVTLCIICHAGYNTSTGSNHGAGSAFNSSTNSGMTKYLQTQCHYCHSSDTTKPARPRPAEDVHGWNSLASGANWPSGNKPYAFMRNSVNWGSSSPKVLSGPGVAAGSATCGGSGKTSSGCTGENMSTYTPGGVY